MYKFIIIVLIVFLTSVAFAGNCGGKPITVSGMPIKYFANNAKIELLINKQQVMVNLNGYKPPLVKNKMISIPNCHKSVYGYYYCPSH